MVGGCGFGQHQHVKRRRYNVLFGADACRIFLRCGSSVKPAMQKFDASRIRADGIVAEWNGHVCFGRPSEMDC